MEGIGRGENMTKILSETFFNKKVFLKLKTQQQNPRKQQVLG